MCVPARLRPVCSSGSDPPSAPMRDPRECSSSLRYALPRCHSTVFGVMKRRCAMSRFGTPAGGELSHLALARGQGLGAAEALAPQPRPGRGELLAPARLEHRGLAALGQVQAGLEALAGVAPPARAAAARCRGRSGHGRGRGRRASARGPPPPPGGRPRRSLGRAHQRRGAQRDAERPWGAERARQRDLLRRRGTWPRARSPAAAAAIAARERQGSTAGLCTPSESSRRPALEEVLHGRIVFTAQVVEPASGREVECVAGPVLPGRSAARGRGASSPASSSRPCSMSISARIVAAPGMRGGGAVALRAARLERVGGGVGDPAALEHGPGPEARDGGRGGGVAAPARGLERHGQRDLRGRERVSPEQAAAGGVALRAGHRVEVGEHALQGSARRARPRGCSGARRARARRRPRRAWRARAGGRSRALAARERGARSCAREARIEAGGQQETRAKPCRVRVVAGRLGVVESALEGLGRGRSRGRAARARRPGAARVCARSALDCAPRPPAQAASRRPGRRWPPPRRRARRAAASARPASGILVEGAAHVGDTGLATLPTGERGAARLPERVERPRLAEALRLQEVRGGALGRGVPRRQRARCLHVGAGPSARRQRRS